MGGRNQSGRREQTIRQRNKNQPRTACLLASKNPIAEAKVQLSLRFSLRPCGKNRSRGTGRPFLIIYIHIPVGLSKGDRHHPSTSQEQTRPLPRRCPRLPLPLLLQDTDSHAAINANSQGWRGGDATSDPPVPSPSQMMRPTLASFSQWQAGTWLALGVWLPRLHPNRSFDLVNEFI